jgi:hypothetical protein
VDAVAHQCLWDSIERPEFLHTQREFQIGRHRELGIESPHVIEHRAPDESSRWQEKAVALERQPSAESTRSDPESHYTYWSPSLILEHLVATDAHRRATPGQMVNLDLKLARVP